MSELPKPAEQPAPLHDVEPGMVLRSTKTNKLLFVTEVGGDKIKGKPITENGELEDPNPDRWIQLDLRVAQSLMVEVKGIDVSRLQGYIKGRVEDVSQVN